MNPKIRKALTYGLPALAALALLIQLVPVTRDNPPVVGDLAAPPEVKALLKRVCYNCHSHETEWPFYSYIAPVSWLVAADVHEARTWVNFSKWSEQSEMARTFIRQNVWSMIEKDKMPPWNYRLMHPESHLTEAEKATIETWANAPAAPAAESSPEPAPSAP